MRIQTRQIAAARKMFCSLYGYRRRSGLRAAESLPAPRYGCLTSLRLYAGGGPEDSGPPCQKLYRTQDRLQRELTAPQPDQARERTQQQRDRGRHRHHDLYAVELGERRRGIRAECD
jgi:hypothetical protein